MAAILGRQTPSQDVVAQKLAELYVQTRDFTISGPSDNSGNALSTTFVAADAVYRTDTDKAIQQRQVLNKPSNNQVLSKVTHERQSTQQYSGGSLVRVKPTAVSGPHHDTSNRRPAPALYPGHSKQLLPLQQVFQPANEQPPRYSSLAGSTRGHLHDASNAEDPRGTFLSSSKQGFDSPGTAAPPPPPSVPTKRRLGMGRMATGYANKKFRPPQS